jgi:hypothetical protein
MMTLLMKGYIANDGQTKSVAILEFIIIVSSIHPMIFIDQIIKVRLIDCNH